ncbi:MAG: DUF4330 domain-containing protein [Clostridia bacterium]|nr:DUF4330 domain-containing protein [Clostridia bacterium]
MRLEEIKIWKFNLLDMFIVFAIVVALLMFFNNKQSIGAAPAASGDTEVKDSKFTYVVEIKDVAETTGQMIESGDKLYDKASGTEMGTIINVDIKQATGGLQLNNGQIVTKEIPERIDVYLTVEAEGRTSNGEFIANNLIRVLVGSFKALKTKYVMFSGTIIDAK